MKEGRNEKGQWLSGVSGNASGRPRKKAALPKSLTDHLADAMTEKIAFTDSEGKQELVPAHEAVARQLVRSLPTSTLKESMATLKWMQALGVFDVMQRRAGTWPEELTLEQARERVAAFLERLKEKQAARG